MGTNGKHSTERPIRAKFGLRMTEAQVLLEPDRGKRMLGRIEMPEAAALRAPVRRGVVVAVGPGPLLQSGERAGMQCEVGDVVWYSPLRAVEVSIGRRDFVVTDDSKLVAVEIDGGDLPHPVFPELADPFLAVAEPVDHLETIVQDIERRGPSV